MQTLSNGYKLPEDGDRGSTFFPALEDNIQRLNDHTHDGNDSERLTALSFDTTTQSILSASWTPVSGGLYKQTITLPGSLQVDNITMEFFIASGSFINHKIYPNVEKISSTQYDIFVNDNTIDLLAKYL